MHMRTIITVLFLVAAGIWIGKSYPDMFAMIPSLPGRG